MRAQLLFVLTLAVACTKEPKPNVSPDPSRVIMAVATVSATATANATVSATAEPASTAPLRSWMKSNVAPALAQRRLPDVADMFDAMAQAQTKQVEKPAKYPNWVSIAKDGAAAARIGNLEATKAACRGCHDQYKTKYAEADRGRAFP
jgi:hypothetical protein